MTLHFRKFLSRSYQGKLQLLLFVSEWLFHGRLLHIHWFILGFNSNFNDITRLVATDLRVLVSSYNWIYVLLEILFRGHLVESMRFEDCWIFALSRWTFVVATKGYTIGGFLTWAITDLSFVIFDCGVTQALNHITIAVSVHNLVLQ